MWIKNIFFLSLLCFPFLLTAQNQPPVVSNVRFSQRPECFPQKVDVYYDVNDPDNCPLNICMQASSDNGTTWNLYCRRISGDVGDNLISGTNKHIVWEFGLEHPAFYSNNVKVKILAYDGNFNGCGTPILYGGVVYNTVQIGSQCWMKENLNIGIMKQSWPSNNGIIEKFCYNNDLTNCYAYGGLYFWNELMGYVNIAGAQGICPLGWHIPTNDELQLLSIAVGNSSNALKAIGQGYGNGQGTNASGFSALLAGSYSATFSHMDVRTYFWSSTNYNDGRVYAMVLYADHNSFYFGDYPVELGFSVRCLKD